jgi:GMP synthase (glutamine-hydrolyzing) (EC 6.3.5.2)
MSLTFDARSFIEEIAPKLREAVKEGRAIAAVSGGVDSTTAAVLAYKVLGPGEGDTRDDRHGLPEAERGREG